MAFSLTSDLTAADKAKLVLHVGSAEFAFSDAVGPFSSSTYSWLNSGLDWSSVPNVTLRLRDSSISTDATLSGLAVKDGSTDVKLTPTFASGTTSYTASVANAVAEVTVTPTKNHARATIEYLNASDMTLADAGTAAGQQVVLAVGANVIKVKVTAEDGTTTRTYTVTATRAPTCTPDTAAGDIWCGVVTVGTFETSGSATAYGFSSSVGNLSDKEFSVGTNDYTIDSITVGAAGTSNAGALAFSLTSDLTAADKAKLVLHVGSAEFAFSDAVGPFSSSTYSWLNSGQDWSSVPNVTLRLRDGSTPDSTDATLSALVVNDGNADLTLTPTFASGKYTYTASVVSTVAEVTVTPTKNDTNATIEYLDESDATLDRRGHRGDRPPGGGGGGRDNVIKVKVTAEDGNATQTYTVTVNRAAAASTCTLNTGDLWCGVVTVGALELFGSTVAYGFTGSVSTSALSDTGFSVGTNNYTIDEIYTGVDGYQCRRLVQFSLTSDLTAADKAKLVLHIDGSSDTFAFSAASGPSHSNTYEWASSGLDWSSTSEVTLRLREAAVSLSSDATLSALVVNDGNADLTLTPTFESGVYTYTASVANTVAEVTVTPTKSDTNATIEYLDASDMTLDDANTTDTGHQVAVAEGDTVIKVKVTAEDGNATQTYMVTVTRAAAVASTDATLSDLVVNDGNMDLTLTPGFASSTIAYMASVATAVTEVTVTPTPNDSGATIEYLDATSHVTLTDADTGVTGQQVAVAVGDTIIQVKVTAADGVTTQTYTVTVNRAPCPRPAC